MSVKSALLLGSALVTGSVFASPTFAQDSASRFAQDEIIVTATKRETALTDTSVAITAFTNEARDRLGIEGIQDVADLTPGVTIQDTPNRISIRGVGRLTNALGSDPGVAVYSDGIYTSETAAIGASTLYNERIEVLRGPQGTLYGRNSVGGAVNTISIRPSDEFEGHARARIGNYDQLLIGGSLSGPVSDNLRLRVAASHDERSGYIENIGAGKDQWANDDFTLEAQAEWDVSDDIQIWTKYGYYEYDTTPRQPVQVSPFSPNVLRGDLVINPSFGSTDGNPTVNDPFKVAYNDTGYLRLDNSHSFTGHLDWDFGAVAFKYMGGYAQYDFSTEFDADGTNQIDDIVLFDADTFNAPLSVPTSQLNFIAESKENFSHDFQLLSNTTEGPEWIVGAYYYEEDVFQPFALRSPGNEAIANPRFALVPGLNGFPVSYFELEGNVDDRYYYQSGTLNSKAYAVYGQASFDVTDQIRLTGGLRYSKDDKTGSEEQRIVFDTLNYSFESALFGVSPFPFVRYGADVTGGTRTDTHEGSWDAVTGMVSAEYRPNDDTLWYGTASRGYKSGGFRLGAISDDKSTTNVDEAEVGEESILSFEIGNKTDFGGVLQLNSAAYIYNYEDLQTEVPIFRSVALIELFNAAEAQVYGFETEATWNVSDNLTVLGSYAYTHAEFEDFCGSAATANSDGTTGCLVDPRAAPGANLVDPSGNTLNKTPEHKFAAIANYTIPVSVGEVSFSATYSHVGSQFYSVFNNPEAEADSYERVDGRVSFFDQHDRFRVHGYIRNAFDEEGVTGASSGGSPYFAINRAYNAPRTFGAEIQVNF